MCDAIINVYKNVLSTNSYICPHKQLRFDISCKKEKTLQCNWYVTTLGQNLKQKLLQRNVNTFVKCTSAYLLKVICKQVILFMFKIAWKQILYILLFGWVLCCKRSICWRHKLASIYSTDIKYIADLEEQHVAF